MNDEQKKIECKNQKSNAFSNIKCVSMGEIVVLRPKKSERLKRAFKVFNHKKSSRKTKTTAITIAWQTMNMKSGTMALPMNYDQKTAVAFIKID